MALLGVFESIADDINAKPFPSANHKSTLQKRVHGDIQYEIDLLSGVFVQTTAMGEEDGVGHFFSHLCEGDDLS